MMIGNLPAAVVLPYSACTVPAGINGPVVIFITTDDQALANNVIIQATETVIAGPTMAFIDIITEDIDTIIKSGSGSSGSGSSSSGGSNASGTATASAAENTSTTTISPGDASSIESSASATATATTTISPGEASSIESSASATLAAAGALATGSPSTNVASVVLAPGGPNQFTGASPDGHTVVLGWTTSS